MRAYPCFYILFLISSERGNTMNIINTFAVGRILNRLSTNDLCLIYSKDELIRNHDVHYPFRPCSNFQYVCRLHETKVMLILRKTQTGHELNLFKPPYDAKSIGHNANMSNFIMLMIYLHLKTVVCRWYLNIPIRTAQQNCTELLYWESAGYIKPLKK